MESIPVPKLPLASRDDDEHQATGLYIFIAFDSYVLLIVPFNVDNPRTEPLLRDIANDGISRVCFIWRKLGTQLKLDSWVMDAVAADHKNVKDCCTNMF